MESYPHFKNSRKTQSLSYYSQHELVTATNLPYAMRPPGGTTGPTIRVSGGKEQTKRFCLCMLMEWETETAET